MHPIKIKINNFFFFLGTAWTQFRQVSNAEDNNKIKNKKNKKEEEEEISSHLAIPPSWFVDLFLS